MAIPEDEAASEAAEQAAGVLEFDVDAQFVALDAVERLLQLRRDADRRPGGVPELGRPILGEFTGARMATLLAEVARSDRDKVEVGVERDADPFDHGGDAEDERQVRREAQRELVHRVLDLGDDLLDAVLFDVLAAGVGDGQFHHLAHHLPVGLR